jgi:hypothetical protein
VPADTPQMETHPDYYVRPKNQPEPEALVSVGVAGTLDAQDRFTPSETLKDVIEGGTNTKIQGGAIEPEIARVITSDRIISDERLKELNAQAVAAEQGTTSHQEPDGMLRYNSGKHRMTLIPASFGAYTAAVLEYGALKYQANNWRKGGSWTSAIDSLQRHIDAFREGEDRDAESGLPHLAHMAFNVMILTEFFDKGFGTDDRFRYPDQLRGQRLLGQDLTFNQPPRPDEKFGAGPVPEKKS